MDLLAPEGSVYQAGTLSGNPVACTAGLATLAQLNTELYRVLEKNTDRLANSIKAAAEQKGIVLDVPHIGSMLGLSFKNPKQYSRLFHLLLQPKADPPLAEAEGIYLPPSAYETLFLSRAHSREVIEKTVMVFQKAFQRL